MSTQEVVEEQPPEPIASDYVEVGTLVFLFIVGGPMNLAAFTQLAERQLSTRLDILKRHLNYSDLLVLFVYVPSRACWLLTYDWRGGDFLCKLIKFLHTFAFQISSNVIVCIAVDRLLSVVSPKHRSPQKALKRTKVFLITAWIAAALFSLPQFAVWKTFLAFEELNWSQCMQIWEIIRIEQSIANISASASHQLMDQENAYVILHMLLIFWVPATIVIVCYLIVSCWVYLNSRPSVLGSSPISNDSLKNSVKCHIDGGGTSFISKSSDWKPLKSILKNRTELKSIGGPSTGPPRLTINDKKTGCSSTNYSAEYDVCSRLGKRYEHNVYMGNSQSYNTKLTRSRALRVSFLLVAAYIICWLPYNGLSLYHFIDPEGFVEADVNKVYCLHSIMVFNSVINPYLYGLFGNIIRHRRR